MNKRNAFLSMLKEAKTSDELLQKAMPMVTPTGSNGELLPEDTQFAKAMGMAVIASGGKKSDWDRLQAAGITNWLELKQECWRIQQGQSKLPSALRITCQIWYNVTKNHTDANI